MKIIFAGGAHYGVGALRSIQKYFDIVYLVKDNPEEILKERRECDIIIDDFDAVECQLVYLGGWADFITAEQLKKKTYINVHGALLPRWRGMHSTFWAIMNGDKELGITFHFVNEYMDAGDILKKFSFCYTGQPVYEINEKIDELVELHSGEVLYNYAKGILVPVPQDETDATYGAKRNLEDCLIDFNWSNELLSRYFFALTKPYPLPMLRIHGDLYEVLDHMILEKDYFGPIGRAVFMDEKGVWIKTREGMLIVSHVRRFKEGVISELRNLIRIGYRFC